MKNRLVLTLLLALAALLLAFGPAATPSMAANSIYRYRYAGKGASAFWSTCPDGPSVGVVCTDTYISTAERVYNENNHRYGGTELIFLQYGYTVDDAGNSIALSETYGWAEATLSIDKQLTSAAASATMQLNVCTWTQYGEILCQDGGTVTVTAAWTGQGDLQRSRDHSQYISKGYKVNSHFWGTYRNATARAQVNGADLGPSLQADMYNNRTSDVTIEHSG